MPGQAVLEATFRLPEEILERVNDSARERHKEPDQVVAEALGYMLPPSRSRIEKRVQELIDRLSALDDTDLRAMAKSRLSLGETKRVSRLLDANRERGLTVEETAELDNLQEKTVQISAERVMAWKILHDRKQAGGATG